MIYIMPGNHDRRRYILDGGILVHFVEQVLSEWRDQSLCRLRAGKSQDELTVINGTLDEAKQLLRSIGLRGSFLHNLDDDTFED